MFIRITRRQAAPGELLEAIAPRGGDLAIAAAEQFLGAAALPEPFALELAATPECTTFLVRAASPAAREQLAEQLCAAYPQAEVRPRPAGPEGAADPARRGAEEQMAACALILRGPDALPLRTFEDPPGQGATADPLAGILGALGGLQTGWRALAQLLLRPAPEDWGRDALPLALERPARPHPDDSAISASEALRTAVFLGAGLAGLQGYLWYQAGDWAHLGLAGAGIVTGGLAVATLRGRRSRPRLVDPRLVRDKLAGGGYVAELRLAVFAPASAERPLIERRLAQVAAAYRQYSHAAGNALVPRRLRLRDDDLPCLRPLRPAGLVGTRELAGLWHLPVQADLPGIARTTARRQTPLPAVVATGCPLGVSLWQGRQVPVALPDELLRRHLLLVAKTRRGKSSVLLKLARYVMEGHGGDALPPALVLIDPHRDLARAALGLVPPGRLRDLVYLELGQLERPFGLNLLDVGLGWGRERAVDQALDIFQRQWEDNWGPRMESAFRFALQTLYAANETLCAEDPGGAARQFTILDVSAVLSDAVFRKSILPLVHDPAITSWWAVDFEPLERRFQLEVINPVQTKIHRYAGSTAARLVVGQPRSTVNPADWVRAGRLVIVNTARGTVGEDTAGLVGATLLNLVAHAVSAQADRPPGERRRVVVVADEFHTNAGADYEGFLGELSKFGASMVLATQSLARLEAMDGAGKRRGLRAILFANLDGLFAFHCSAEDAAYLLPELGSGLEVDDLVGLGEHQCYARLSGGGERLPAFSLRLDPPPQADPGRAERLAAASFARHGRPRAEVEADLAAALARLAEARQRWLEETRKAEEAKRAEADRRGRDPRQRRNENRNQGGQASRRDAEQPRLDTEPAPDDAPELGPDSPEMADGGEA